MSRGTRPVVAVAEAKRYARAAGFLVIELTTEAELPVDFIVQKSGISSLVRVRRLKQSDFRVINIMRSCMQPIREVRAFIMPDGLVRELWIRGPARAFHRFRVLPETVEEIGVVAQPASLKKTDGPGGPGMTGVSPAEEAGKQKTGEGERKTKLPGKPSVKIAAMISGALPDGQKLPDTSREGGGMPIQPEHPVKTGDSTGRITVQRATGERETHDLSHDPVEKAAGPVSTAIPADAQVKPGELPGSPGFSPALFGESIRESPAGVREPGYGSLSAGDPA